MVFVCRYYCPIIMKFEFYEHIFEKKLRISGLMKIRPLRAELLRLD